MSWDSFVHSAKLVSVTILYEAWDLDVNKKLTPILWDPFSSGQTLAIPWLERREAAWCSQGQSQNAGPLSLPQAV